MCTIRRKSVYSKILFPASPESARALVGNQRAFPGAFPGACREKGLPYRHSWRQKQRYRPPADRLPLPSSSKYSLHSEKIHPLPHFCRHPLLIRRHERATDRVEQALELLGRFGAAAEDPELLMLQGDLLYALKRFKEAKGVYRRAAGTDSRQAGQAWLLAGYAAWRTNDFNASRRAFQNAAKYRKQRKAALLALAQLKSTP